MKKMKVIHWPKRVVPDPEIHKLEGEFFHDNMDVFAGHQDYRPDCITRSPTYRFLSPDSCESYIFEVDPNSYMDVRAYALPGDFGEDAGW